MTSSLTQSKTEFLTEALLEQVNNIWKVNSIESGRNFYSVLTYEVNKKYIKVFDSTVRDGVQRDDRSIFLFVDKETGAVYKPASYKAPAKGIRFYIDFLNDYPEIVDQYGSFLYLR
jgi:hypothetical protein